ncbi:MAG: LysM peptidoglycan-binding domain-containing protein, partial [Streptosporangiaceae bacterium]
VQRRVAVYVTVRPGDCLWTIAVAHHVTVSALYRANRAVVGANPNLIYAGERLRIPANYAPRSKR